MALPAFQWDCTTQCCRAFTLALARLSCFSNVYAASILKLTHQGQHWRGRRIFRSVRLQYYCWCNNIIIFYWETRTSDPIKVVIWSETLILLCDRIETNKIWFWSFSDIPTGWNLEDQRSVKTVLLGMVQTLRWSTYVESYAVGLHTARIEQYGYQTFPGQDVSRTDVSRTDVSRTMKMNRKYQQLTTNQSLMQNMRSENVY